MFRLNPDTNLKKNRMQLFLNRIRPDPYPQLWLAESFVYIRAAVGRDSFNGGKKFKVKFLDAELERLRWMGKLAKEKS